MQFYHANRFIYPDQLRFRLIGICVAVAFAPLAILAIIQLTQGRFVAGDAIVLLGAAVIAAAAGVGAVHWLLLPIMKTTDALNMLDEQPVLPPEMCDGPTLMGMLISSVNRAAAETHDMVQRLDETKYRDSVTGLWNRRGFETKAAAVSALYDRNALAILSIDGFDQITLRYGEQASVSVLRLFAERLSNGLRRADVISHFGSGEFVVLAAGATPRDATTILERMAQVMRQEPMPILRGDHIRFSGGVADCHADMLEASMHEADQALENARQEGHDRIIPFLRAVG